MPNTTATNRINLRNSGNGGDAYLKDAVIHQYLAGLAFGIQSYSPVITFLNGEYYGILNARERRDARYLESNYGVSRKSVDLIKANQKVQTGSDENWQEFVRFLQNNEPETDYFLTQVQGFIDIDSFIDLYSASIYLARNDWPANNNAYWRSATPTGTGPDDGRWRWLLYDADSSMAKTGHETLKMATATGNSSWPNPDWSTLAQAKKYQGLAAGFS